MSMYISLCKRFAIMAMMFWVVGCVQTKTTPGYARAGDNIVIGLGGVARNAGGEANLKASDLTITLTDADASYTLEPSYIFKSYLDHSAQMNTFTLDGTTAVGGLVGMVPYDGGWFVVTPLRFPEDGSPLPLVPGDATISVTSAKLTNTANLVEGNLDAIPLEIIEGVSEVDLDFIRQFVGYIPTPDSFVIKPAELAGVDAIGGASLVITYQDDSLFITGLQPVVVPSSHNPYVQMNYNVIANGDGTGTIHVTLLNPAGFRTLETATANTSLLSDLSLNLNYFPSGTTEQLKANFALDADRSYYIDMDGVALPNVVPALIHIEDL